MRFQEIRRLIREVLLLEARIDRAAAKYPEISDMILSDLQDVPGKFIDWAAKQLSLEPTPGIASKLVTLTQRFEDLTKRNRVKQKDINAYKTLSDLESTVEQATQKKSVRQQRIAKKADSQVFLDDDRYFIVVPESRESSCYYGRDTKWCISATKSQNYWDHYVQQVGFVFIFPKRVEDPRYKKLALVVGKDGEVQEAYDAEDEKTFDFENLFDQIRDHSPEASRALDQALIAASELPKKALDAKVKKTYKEALQIAKELGVPDNHVQMDDHTLGPHDPMVIIGDPARGDYDTGWYVEMFPNGTRSFYFNGELHRDDGPAEITHTKKRWYQHGKLHRDDGPAVFAYRDANYQVLDSEKWYRNGKMHRDGAPAQIIYDDTGAVVRELWYENGKQHREDGPAYVSYEDGEVFSERYYLNGRAQSEKSWRARTGKLEEVNPRAAKIMKQYGLEVRERSMYAVVLKKPGDPSDSHKEGMAVMVWADDNPNTNVAEEWMLDNELHREDGPALISVTGSEMWYQYGKLHREDGPAIISSDGVWKWYLNDVAMTEEEWRERTGN